MSVIASYIFYFFVVHLKSEKDKENIYGYIAKKTGRIIGDAKSLILTLRNESRVNFEGDYPSLIDVEKMCKAVNPNGRAPLVIGSLGNYASWIQYLDYYKNRTEKSIREIYTQMPFLESSYLKRIVAIEDCGYFYSISMAVSLTLKNTDLSAFAKEMFEYFERVKVLEDYASRELKSYKLD